MKVRVFTLRLPEDLYLHVSDIALKTGRTNNAVVTGLVRTGLDRSFDARELLKEMFNKEFPDNAFAIQS